MQNNLLELIHKKRLTQLEFGKLVWKDAEYKTDRQIKTMQTKVGRYCRMDLKLVRVGLIDKFCKILECGYDDLWNPKSN